MARRAPDRTRERLLQAATRLFGERGYKHVTVRDISREARANVAAVNYHFRDKMGLYSAVIEQGVSLVRDITAAAIEAGRGRPAAEQLAAYIRVHGDRLYGERSKREQDRQHALQQVIHREFSEPTPALSRLIDRAFRPRFEYLRNVIDGLLGDSATPERVTHCAMSVHAQLFLFRPKPVVMRIAGDTGPAWQPDAIVSHITAFSLAGLEAYKHPPLLLSATRQP